MNKKFFLAFLMNAIIIALISTITIETKDLLDLHAYQQKNIYNFNPNNNNTSLSKRIKNFKFWKFLAVLLISFLITLLIYIIVYFVSGKDNTFMYLLGNLDSISVKKVNLN